MLWTSSEQVASVLQAMAEARHAEALRIGRLIASLRERNGWSQEDLAHEIDVSTSTISRWERGLHKGYSPNVRKLAEALEVEPAVLLPADDLLIGSQLDRIEANTEEILRLLRGEDEATIAAAAELEDRLPAELSEADAKPTRRAPARSAKKQAAARRNPS